MIWINLKLGNLEYENKVKLSDSVVVEVIFVWLLLFV